MHTTTSASQRAYDHVRARLEKGEFAPGTRLVTRNIARELGTSLNPVREALSRLSSQGLIAHVPGAGMFVHAPTAQEVNELYGVREAIESYSAAEAARRITEDELATLDGICDEIREVGESMRARGIERLPPDEAEAWAEREERFRRVVVEASRNTLLSRIIAEQSLLAGVFRRHQALDLAITRAVVSQVLRVHTELVESLRNRDSERARTQVAEALRVGCRNLLTHMQGQGH